ncbi:hypothetical protein BDW74DRAFT_178577 [Aspergillus multicolor]|uniref:uncharacterized protein n=1 Tax=Aspergillus multicolor TaxID=41759 RepID=UPI003CCCFE5D
MAASLIISVIGTLITTVSFIDSNMPEHPEQAKIEYVIANDGANGDLSNAGGDLPDIRLFDETAEFLAGTYDPGSCDEGYTICTTDIDTQEAPTYTLFTANNDAICIAWAGLAWAGGQRKYGFHPGNWAYSCDAYTDYNNGYWYYAGQAVPGLDTVDDVKCAWLDADGDIPITAFQVHWPEFDGDEANMENLDYYCQEKPPVEYYDTEDPSTIWYWPQTAAFSDDNSSKRRLPKRFENDPRIIKSHFAKHMASELCDQAKSAAGQSFFSYEEKLFCYMPTKTLFPFCETVESGSCWSDEETKAVVKGPADAAGIASTVPDLSHITETIVWGQ